MGLDKTLDSGAFVSDQGFGGVNADDGYYFKNCIRSFCLGYRLPAREE